eukprot:scaffold115323_cov17-Prasinocladus_malaysianus.AAC.1
MDYIHPVKLHEVMEAASFFVLRDGAGDPAFFRGRRKGRTKRQPYYKRCFGEQMPIKPILQRPLHIPISTGSPL